MATENNEKKVGGRPSGIKTISGSRKEIRRFLARMTRDFKVNYENMTPAEKNECIIKYLNGEI